MFHPWCFFLFRQSPLVLRAGSTDRPETLPHGRNSAEFYNPTPKTWEALPRKNLGPKTCKISVNFGPLQTLIANIFETAQDIQIGKLLFPDRFLLRSMKKIRWTFSTNYRDLDVSLDPLKMHFLGYYISALRGCLALKCLHALEIVQALLAHSPSGAGSPKKF